MGVFVPKWLVLRRCEATNLGVFDPCHFALIWPYSNGAVQIRVGLELAENGLPLPRTPDQEVLNPTPLNPTPATCHKRKRKLRCSLWSAALQKLHCNIRFSAVRTSFVPKAALQQAGKMHCNIEIAALQESGAFLPLSCGFQAPTFRHPRLGLADLICFMLGHLAASNLTYVRNVVHLEIQWKTP